MGYDYGYMAFTIDCDSDVKAFELRQKLESRFPSSSYYFAFDSVGGSVTISSPIDNPGYSVDDELEELADFLGPSVKINGFARFEDGCSSCYRTIIDGEVIYADNAWIDELSVPDINRLEELSQWILKYTPEQVERLKEIAENTFGGKDDN